MEKSRVHKSFLNARVNVIFYFLTLFLAFYSRKVFLQCLSAEFIGLTGTIGNILGYLNLAELGIGFAVSCFLYKPIEESDKKKLQEIISVLGYLYSKIGLFIFVAGIIISMSFPWIFGKTSLGLGIVYFSYFCFLSSSLIGYFINYRQILLSADQKNYVVSAYFQTSNILKTGIQIFLAYTYKNLYLWMSIELLFGIIACVILNWKINKEYPWLHSNLKEGARCIKNYSEIIKATKQIFIHNIKDFVLTRSDEIFIFVFISLKMVAYYSNYMMIINKVLTLVTSILDGIGSGVGSLVAEGNNNKIVTVFWQLISLRYFIAGCVVFSIFQLINPFISLWLGSEYVLKEYIVVLLLINLFISETRGVVDMFNHAYGNYSDVWSAWTELFVNLLITVLVGYFYGIIGILLGKIISTFLIIVLWKPYYLFSKGFLLPVISYWKNLIPYYLVFILSFIICLYLTNLLNINPYCSFKYWCLYAICNISIFISLYMPLLLLCNGTKGLILRLLNYSPFKKQ